jgi:hypothetical protein
MALFNSLGSISHKRKSGELGDADTFPRKKPLWAGSSDGDLEGACWNVQW